MRVVQYSDKFIHGIALQYCTEAEPWRTKQNNEKFNKAIHKFVRVLYTYVTHGSVEGDPPYLKPQPHIMASEANRERTHARASNEAAPRTHLSFHIRLSRDFSRRRRMESLLAGKRQIVRVVSPLRVRQTNSFLQDEAYNFRSFPRWPEHLQGSGQGRQLRPN